MENMLFLAKCFYFLLPAYFANMTPVVAKRMNILNSLALPVDGGRRLWGEPILGRNKTIRGFLLGSIAGALIFFIQTLLFSFNFFQPLSFLDYSDRSIAVIGYLFGFCSLIGDALGSFLKRRFRVGCGERCVPLDQISLLFGCMIFIPPTFIPFMSLPRTFDFYILLIMSFVIITFFWHIVATRTANLLKIRAEKW